MLKLVINELLTKKYSPRPCLIASDIQVKSQSKELRGLRSCQDPHIRPLFAFSCQHTNENVCSQNVAEEVTMCGNLSCYQVFRCFLTPIFVLLDASAKFRCLGKLSHLSLLGWHVKRVILYPTLLYLTTKSPILHVVPMRTHNNPPIVQKGVTLLLFAMSQPFVSIPGPPLNHKLSFGPAVHLTLLQ